MVDPTVRSMNQQNLNIESPRHQCAMSQLGIVPSELQSLDAKLLEEAGFSPEAIELKVNMHEKKRKGMLRQLQETVSSITAKDLELFQSVLDRRRPKSAPSGSQSLQKSTTKINDPSIAEILEKENSRMQVMQEQMKNELATTLINEIKAKELMVERAKRDAIIKQKHEEERQRLKKQAQEQEALAAKKQQKREDIILKAASAMKEMAAANQVKAASKMEKIQIQKQKLADARVVARVEKDAKTAVRKQDRLEKQDKAFSNLLHELEVKAQRDEAIEQRREEVREHFRQQAEKRQQDFEECRQRVEDKKNEDEQKVLAFYSEHSQRMDKAREVFDSLGKERLKDISDRNRLRSQRFEKSLARSQSESASFRREMDIKLDNKFGKSFKEKQQQRRDEFTSSLKARRETSHESVSENRARLKRAQVFYEDQKLVGITGRIEKVNCIRSTRQNMQEQRTQALQKCWIEKNHMELIFDRVKYVNNPNTLYRIASSVGVDIDAIQRGSGQGDAQPAGGGHAEDD